MARILVVDDDKDILTMLKDWLSFDNHSVDVVANGTEGWEKMQEQKHDLLILDWDLPDSTGIDLLKRYRTTGGTAAVVMLTGRGDVENKAEGLDFGADDYLTKPFHMKELQSRIRSVLRRLQTHSEPPKPLGTGNEEILQKGGLIGTTLAARYEFLSVLGEGTTGIVYKARQPNIGRFVAVKMLQAEELSDEVFARFEQEAQIISRLDQPNIASIHDFGVTESKQPYIVMEFIEGKNLQELLDERGRLLHEQAVDIGIQLCDGLSHAHASGVIHRDLKPSNVMVKSVIGSPPLYKILDFGCAKISSPNGGATKALTRMGQLIGTPLYMSPELITGKSLDKRADIYSLGCVLYHLISGQPPFMAEMPADVLIKHVKEDLVPMTLVTKSSIPLELERSVARALEKDPDKRFQTMREFKEALEPVKQALLSKGTGKWWQLFGKRG